MNVATWLNDMQRLYNSLCDLEGNRMSDHEFTFAILDLMPLDDGWRTFITKLRHNAREADAHKLPINSVTYISAIRDEFWYKE